jgi:hypothetical protein
MLECIHRAWHKSTYPNKRARKTLVFFMKVLPKICKKGTHKRNKHCVKNRTGKDMIMIHVSSEIGGSIEHFCKPLTSITTRAHMTENPSPMNSADPNPRLTSPFVHVGPGMGLTPAATAWAII